MVSFAPDVDLRSSRTEKSEKISKLDWSSRGAARLKSQRSLLKDQNNAAKRAGIYSDKNHWSVIMKAHGSVWPKVLPFCLFNTLVTFVIWWLKNRYDFDMSIHLLGHKFMTMLVTFLLTGRLKNVYNRFMTARTHLGDLYRSCRELVQHVVFLTAHDKSEGAMEWRHNVSYRTILLLRVTMGTIEFKNTNSKPWDVPELNDEEKRDIESVLLHCEKNADTSVSNSALSHLSHGYRQLIDEAYRAPIVLAYNLRREIVKWRQGGMMKKPFRHVNEELEILDFVTQFSNAYHGLRILANTPFPFPLVQMGRTFLAFWVFTLPFALCSAQYELIGLLWCIFFVTYGFVGLEYVSTELDDPFGDDATDFDDLGMAETVYEDIYIAIYKADGDTAAYQLRERIAWRKGKGSALHNYRMDYMDSVHSRDSYSYS